MPGSRNEAVFMVELLNHPGKIWMLCAFVVVKSVKCVVESSLAMI